MIRITNRLVLGLVFLGCASGFAAPGQAAIHVVAWDGSGDFATIQEAIDAADPGDIIELLDGTFTGDGNRDLDFGGKDLTVRSQNGNPAACIIDPDGSQEEPHRGFYFHSGETSASLIEGITITGGHWHHPTTGGRGGGAIRCEGSALTVRTCIISACTATSGASPMGGGISIHFESHLILEGCTLENNVCEQISGNTGSGGAIGCQVSILEATDCLFRGNSAGAGGGGAWLASYEPSSFTNCVFEGNTGQDGGAIRAGAYLTISHCLFTDNSATGTGPWESGGAILLMEGIIDHCTFARNSSVNPGAHLFVVSEGGADVTLSNSIAAFSLAGGGIAALATQDIPTVLCCDVYGNTGGNYDGVIIPDQTGINGNISEDPIFCDMPADDFTIEAHSPGLPANNDCQVRMGAFDLGCNTPVEASSWSRVKALYYRE